MAIAVDFEHSAEVAAAILTRIEGNLPAVWTDKLNPVTGLRRIEFGRFNAWNFSGQDGDREAADLIPSILLRFATDGERPDISAIGGTWGREIPFTVVHLFGDEQCYDLTAPHRPIQAELAKSQRAKAINKAIWADATEAHKLTFGLGAASALTSDDTDAHVLTSMPGPILYRVEEDAGEVGVHAIGVQFSVLTYTK